MSGGEGAADGWLADTRTSYDTVAASYADLLRHHLAGDPHDRAVLALFAELVLAEGGGAVADVGCGPGQVTAYLRDLGVDAFGIDLSPGMVEMDHDVPAVLRHFHRVVRPGGILLLGFHVGDESRVKTAGYGGGAAGPLSSRAGPAAPLPSRGPRRAGARRLRKT